MFARIAYVSRAAAGLTTPDALEIARGAAERNRRRGLTGALLFADGHFVQVLEGETLCVRDRIEAIAADPRHHAMDLRLARHVHDRLFEGEWMTLRQGNEIATGLKERFEYRPGLPGELFDGDRLVAFVHACCRADAPARRRAVGAC